MQPSRTIPTALASKASLLYVHPTMTDLVRSLDMNFDGQIPIGIRHILEADIPQDPGVVDENVYPAEFSYGRLDNPLSILNAVVICYCFAASSSDLVDDNVRCLHRDQSAWRPPAWFGDFMFRQYCTLEDCPSPLNEPPRSLTTTLAPRPPKKVAYAFPSPPPAPVTTTVWPS